MECRIVRAESTRRGIYERTGRFLENKKDDLGLPYVWKHSNRAFIATYEHHVDTKGQFRLMEFRIGLVVSRPLSIESLKMAEGIAGI